jgi:DinB superfamily
MPISDEVAARLTHGVEDLIARAEAVGVDLYHVPAEGEWSAMQNLAHVAELVPFWSRRARDVALGRAERFGRTPEEWDQRAEAVASHGRDALPAMLSSLRAALRDGVAALREIPDDAWSRSAELEAGGQRLTVAELVELRLTGHVEAHLRQATDAARSAAAH